MSQVWRGLETTWALQLFYCGWSSVVLASQLGASCTGSQPTALAGIGTAGRPGGPFPPEPVLLAQAVRQRLPIRVPMVVDAGKYTLRIPEL